jgi:uncharacterized protein
MGKIAELANLKPISADSHITEPPRCYIDRIDPKFRERAPYMVEDPVKGATFILEGVGKVGIGGLASAGMSPAELRKAMVRNFDVLPKGGWDAKCRVEAMDRDRVYAEVVYPSLGMVLYSVPDQDYMKACMDAYNRWLQEYVSELPGRLFGIGQSQARNPDALIKDMEQIKSLGLKGVMMPVQPGESDYDDPIYSDAWDAAVELKLPLSFHVLPKGTGANSRERGIRGSRLIKIMNVIRTNQDILGVFIFGGVFDRHPDLKVVCVEADAGWVPHYVYRMDHAYERFAPWLESTKLSKPPSEFFYKNVYLTFQDDKAAFDSVDQLNSKNLLWASDYPHSDSTWPKSMEVLEEHTRKLDQSTIKSIIHDNVARLYELDIDVSVSAAIV